MTLDQHKPGPDALHPLNPGADLREAELRQEWRRHGSHYRRAETEDEDAVVVPEAKMRHRQGPVGLEVLQRTAEVVGPATRNPGDGRFGKPSHVPPPVGRTEPLRIQV